MGDKNIPKVLQKQKNSFSFSVEDYILYILSKLEPERSDKLKLNKVAFFTEFAYLYFKQRPLSFAKYAAIDKGPVIDTYTDILERMSKEGKIVIDGYRVRPLASPKTKVPEEVESFIGPLIKKYALLGNDELIALSHKTDSYLITTDNETVMGKIIDKNLASLETFFEDTEIQSEDSFQLPKINKNNLVKYEHR